MRFLWIFIVFIVSLHTQSAKKIIHDVKDIFLQAHSEDAQLDELLSILYQTTTQKPRYPDATTYPMPYFESALTTLNNTVQLGADITFHCYVRELTEQDKVSWLRRSGDSLSLLSVGHDRYSSDKRHAPNFRSPHDWQLRLENAILQDQGVYECQVSSHPPLVQRYYLTVVVPELEIADERGLPIRKKFYNSGSTIELKCLVSKVPDQLHFIMWRLGDRVLNYDQTRGGISVKTEVYEDGAMSRLFIANAKQQDSGNYTCSLGELAHASVAIAVINAESPAAMHVGKGTYLAPNAWLSFIALLTILYFKRLMNFERSQNLRISR